MTRSASRLPKFAFAIAIIFSLVAGLTTFSQQPAPATTQATTAQSSLNQSAATPSPASQSPAQPTDAARRRAPLRAKRQVHRRLSAPSSTAQPQQPPASIAAQRQRDQDILNQQKAQSAATGRENDALTQKGVRDQQKVQAEPRIQDTPVTQPLPGDSNSPSDPPRIQDAPGPAQTQPRPPPAPQS